MTDYAIGGTK